MEAGGGMMKTGRALVAIADRENRDGLAKVLELCGLGSIYCSTGGEVQTIFESEATGVLFCDTALANGSFDDLPRDIGSGRLRIPVIVCSRFYDPAIYLDVMNRGAFDFIVYPYRTDDVQWILGTAFRRVPEPALKSQANSHRAMSA
jgi:DNA-binding NtrC family response regulator